MWTDALAIHIEMSSAAAKLTPQKSIVSKKNYWKVLLVFQSEPLNYFLE